VSVAKYNLSIAKYLKNEIGVIVNADIKVILKKIGTDLGRFRTFLGQI